MYIYLCFLLNLKRWIPIMFLSLLRLPGNSMLILTFSCSKLTQPRLKKKKYFYFLFPLLTPLLLFQLLKCDSSHLLLKDCDKERMKCLVLKAASFWSHMILSVKVSSVHYQMHNLSCIQSQLLPQKSKQIYYFGVIMNIICEKYISIAASVFEI